MLSSYISWVFLFSLISCTLQLLQATKTSVIGSKKHMYPVLRIRIRSDPDVLPDPDISPPNPDPDPALVVFKKISVSVQYRAYVYLFTP